MKKHIRGVIPLLILSFFCIILFSQNFVIAETVEISHSSNRVSIAEPEWNDYSDGYAYVGIVVTDPEVYWSTSHFQFVGWLPKDNFADPDAIAPFSAKDCEVRYEKSDGVIVGHADVSITTTTNYCTVIVEFTGMDLSAYSTKTLLWVEGLEDSGLNALYYTSQLNWSPEAENVFLASCDYWNPNTNKPVPAFDQSGDVEGYHYVSYPSEFYHTLQYNYNQSYRYNQLDIIKNDTYGIYSSNCTVSILDSEYNIIQEMTNQTEAGWDSENISLKLFDSYIEYIDGELLEVKIDPFAFPGFIFTEYFTFTPPLPDDDGVLNTLSGTIKDAKTNAIIPSNPINLSTATGYGGSYSTTSTGAGAYSITNIIDDIYYIQANRSGYENYTFQKNITSNTEHIIYMVENITLDANKSGVYGIVTNYYNATGVPTTWMKISNDTWYQITYTNQNGYYEFLNFAPGNYTIQAQKTGYFPYEAALTFSSNELKYVPIELVSEEIPPDPTPTPTPPVTNILTPFRAIIASFGISESLGGALIALFIIIIMGALFARAGTIAAIGGMFFGFIISIAMSLLPAYLLAITIIVVILLILRVRGDL